MTDLLTLNGIPPQVIGAFNATEQQALALHAENTVGDRYFKPPYPQPLMPFVQHCNSLIASFKLWGANIYDDKCHTTLWSNTLKKGETTFTDDFNLHSDLEESPMRLRSGNVIVLRVLCTSSTPADFVNLTDQADMLDILDQYRLKLGGRVFDTKLLEQINNIGGKIVTPKPWDVIAFDTITPHLPKGACEENRRALMTARFEMKLTSDWRDRVRDGDVPRLPSPGQNL